MPSFPTAEMDTVAQAVPGMINTIWMLTDFTIENGATGVVPMSHRSRLKRPPSEITPESPLIKPVTGRARLGDHVARRVVPPGPSEYKQADPRRPQHRLV